MLVFNKAFFGGSFFQKDVLNKSVEWNKIFFPLRAGPSIHLFKLAWYLDPMQKFPVFIGHSGLSGALSYYNAENNLYISCTVNQIAYPDSSFKLMIKLVSRILKS